MLKPIPLASRRTDGRGVRVNVIETLGCCVTRFFCSRRMREHRTSACAVHNARFSCDDNGPAGKALIEEEFGGGMSAIRFVSDHSNAFLQHNSFSPVPKTEAPSNTRASTRVQRTKRIAPQDTFAAEIGAFGSPFECMRSGCRWKFWCQHRNPHVSFTTQLSSS